MNNGHTGSERIYTLYAACLFASAGRSGVGGQTYSFSLSYRLNYTCRDRSQWKTAANREPLPAARPLAMEQRPLVQSLVRLQIVLVQSLVRPQIVLAVMLPNRFRGATILATEHFATRRATRPTSPTKLPWPSSRDRGNLPRPRPRP